MKMLFCSCVGLFTATIIMSEAFAFASTHTVPVLPTCITTGPRIPESNTAMSLLHRGTVRNNKGAASSSCSSSQRIDSTSTSLNLIHKTIVSTPRGGGGSGSNANSKLTALFTAASGSDQTEKCPFSKAMAIFGSVWGSFGVVYILAKAILRVVPIALEPWQRQSSLVFTPIQWRYVHIRQVLCRKCRYTRFLHLLTTTLFPSDYSVLPILVLYGTVCMH